MECEHIWLSKEIPTPGGGYMRLRFCHVCREAEGYGFLNKEHEINYLNMLYDSDGSEDDML